MLDDKTMTSLEALIGLEGGALKEAIESDDSKEITIPEGQFVDSDTHQVFSNEQLKTREDSLKKTHENAGAEMLIKKYKKDNDLEFDGKTIEHLRAFDKENILKDAGQEPDAKILELEKKNTKLIESNQDWESKHDNLLATNTKAESKRKTDGSILSHMKGDYSISTERMLTNFNAEHEISTDSGVTTISRGGTKLEDGKTFEPLSIESVVSEWSKEFAKNPEGGNGGGDSGGGSKGGFEAFKKQQEDAGNSYGSEAYMRAEAKAITDGTLTV